MRDKAYNILSHFLHHFIYNIRVLYHLLLTAEYNNVIKVSAKLKFTCNQWSLSIRHNYIHVGVVDYKICF
jgi:hypothetical protein